MNSRERILADLILLFALSIPVMAQVSNPNLITMENKISFGASSTSLPFLMFPILPVNSCKLDGRLLTKSKGPG